MEILLRDLLNFSKNVHSEEPAGASADLTAALTEALAVLEGRIRETETCIRAQPLPITRGETKQMGACISEFDLELDEISQGSGPSNRYFG